MSAAGPKWTPSSPKTPTTPATAASRSSCSNRRSDATDQAARLPSCSPGCPALPDDRIRSDLGTPEGVSYDVAASMPPHVLEHLGDCGVRQRLDRILRRL